MSKLRAEGGMKGFKITQEGIVFLLCMGTFVTFSLILDSFLQLSNLISIMRSMSILGIVSLGMALVVIARGIDLCMIATMAVSGLWAMIMAKSCDHFGLVLLVAALFVVSIGLVMGFLIAYAQIPALFASLAMGLVVYGFGRKFLFQIDKENSPSGIDWFDFIGHGQLFGIPFSVCIFLLFALGTHLLLRYTRFGRFTYAIGDNPLAAALTGVPVRPMIVAQYVTTSIFAYCAGLVMASAVWEMNARIYYSTMIYDVVLVVVIGGIGLSGGKGSVRNVLVGTLLIGTLLNGMTLMNLTYMTQNLVKSLVLLSAIIIDTFINPRDEQTAQEGDI